LTVVDDLYVEDLRAPETEAIDGLHDEGVVELVHVVLFGGLVEGLVGHADLRGVHLAPSIHEPRHEDPRGAAMTDTAARASEPRPVLRLPEGSTGARKRSKAVPWEEGRPRSRQRGQDREHAEGSVITADDSWM